MVKIYVGFSYVKKFKIAPFLIKTWMRKDYSHVYLRFESSNQKVPSNVYHAHSGMVHFITFENFKLENKVIKEYCLEVTDEVRLDTLIDCMYKSAVGYGYSEIIKILLTDIGHFFGIKIKTRNSKGYICSELVGSLLTNRLGLRFEKPLHLLKPSDVDDKLIEHTGNL